MMVMRVRIKTATGELKWRRQCLLYILPCVFVEKDEINVPIALSKVSVFVYWS